MGFKEILQCKGVDNMDNPLRVAQIHTAGSRVEDLNFPKEVLREARINHSREAFSKEDFRVVHIHSSRKELSNPVVLPAAHTTRNR